MWGGSQDGAIGAGQEEQSGDIPAWLLGESQLLAFTHCQPRWGMQAGLRGRAGSLRLSKDVGGSVSCQEPC